MDHLRHVPEYNKQYRKENELISRSSQGRVLVRASGVMAVEAGGRPHHKKRLMRAQGYA